MFRAKLMHIDAENSEYLNILRGASILQVMMGHLGLSWFFPPYSEYLAILLPVFFFVSGAVSYNAMCRARSQFIYFFNRYIALILPFWLFSFIFIAARLYSSWPGDIYQYISYGIGWPDLSIYPFDMRQLWFINCLLFMFLLSYPIFLTSKCYPIILWLALLASLSYSIASESIDFYSVYNSVPAFEKLILNIQLHQVIALSSYYFFGALYYRYEISHKLLAILSLLCLPVILMLHFQLGEIENWRVFFFKRGVYFTLWSFVVIFGVLFFQVPIVKWLSSWSPLKRYLLFLSTNSYSLFLIHTPLIIGAEKLGLDQLGDKPLLAMLKMVLVIAAASVLAPWLTKVTTYCIKKIKIAD